uniref:RNase H type-1 domain-containing protein n=1 Tax=Hordeum vulgare subsp. vulgare TaxID=112509 RepID=A0A8I7BI56_HORVV
MRMPQKWKPPDEGWVKVNSDGAVSRRGEGGCGGGDVLRDHHGAFLAASCHHFPTFTDPISAEIHACRRALQVATEINATRVHIELDAKEVVDMLNNPAKNLSVLGPWIQEIKTSMGVFDDAKISWVRRSTECSR